jgi:hypothetical protein
MGEENTENADNRYRIELAGDGVPQDAGSQVATDIKDEFGHRPWHENVQCEWNGAVLILIAENDYDSDGRALLDEFSDAIAACIAEGFDGNIRLVSVKEL